jgi:hypothetical protein
LAKDKVKTVGSEEPAQPAQRALLAAGVKRIEDRATRRREQIAALHGMGPRALASIAEKIRAQGLRFLLLLLVCAGARAASRR